MSFSTLEEGRMMSFWFVGARVAFVTALLASAGGALSVVKAPTDGEAVIRAMHDKYAKRWYRTLSFTQQTTLRTKADTMAKETWKERSVLPGRLRIDIERAAGDLTAVYSGDSLFVWRGDSTLTRAATRNILLIIGFDVYTQSADSTLAALRSEHFAMTPLREDSWKGRPVYVLGAATGDLHSHQLWIEKERLLFVRAIQPDERDSTKTVDFRFDNYVQVPGGWLSETVEAYTDSKLVQREEYSDVHTNIPIDPQIFVPPASR
ncbi:MAG: hypothetical protein ABI889_00830 [Gemmatimonadota bacterium]